MESMIRRLGEIFSKILVVGFLCMPFISVAQIDIGDDLSKINYDHPVDYYIGGIEVEGVKYFDKKYKENFSKI